MPNDTIAVLIAYLENHEGENLISIGNVEIIPGDLGRIAGDFDFLTQVHVSYGAEVGDVDFRDADAKLLTAGYDHHELYYWHSVTGSDVERTRLVRTV